VTGIQIHRIRIDKGTQIWWGRKFYGQDFFHNSSHSFLVVPYSILWCISNFIFNVY